LPNISPSYEFSWCTAYGTEVTIHGILEMLQNKTHYKVQVLNKLTNIAVAETEDLTAKNTIILEKLIVSQLVEKFPALNGAQRSLPSTQKSTYHKLGFSSPRHIILFI